MSSQPDNLASQDERVNEAIADWLEAAEQGRAPDTQSFLLQHPEIAAELREFFTADGRLQQIAGDMDLGPPPLGERHPAAKFEDHPPARLPAELSSPSGDKLPPRPVGRRFHNYEVRDEIARGGMGIVFAGRDLELGRDIAIKVLRPAHPVAEPDLWQRFIDEAQIAGQLQHPGIAPVYELGCFPDQRPYFTMKLVQGQTLARLLAERSDVHHDRLRFLKIFEQVCQTLAYAHSRGVIHRDLKPSNIMVGAFGEVQVMDWGLAKVLPGSSAATVPPAGTAPTETSSIRTARRAEGDNANSSLSETQAGSVLGTLSYMPPEQARGETDQLDRRADVFGLGAILCEILSGRAPYVSDNSKELHRQAQQADLTAAFDRLQHCGAHTELIALARRALAADREDRPADAAVLASEITAHLEGVEVRLREAELAEAEANTRASEERRRRKLKLSLSSLALLALAGGIIGTTWGMIRADRALQSESQQRETLRRQLYVADMQLAHQIWESEDGTARNVQELLTAQLPRDGQADLRDFAWRLQWTALYNNSRLLRGHTGGAKLVALTPQGQWLTLDDEQTLRHWDPSRGTASRREELAGMGPISCRAISGDGRSLALGTDKTVHLFETDTGRKIGTFTGQSLVLRVCFSGDDRQLAAVWGDGTVQLWQTPNGLPSATFRLPAPDKPDFIEGLGLSADGESLWLIGYPQHKQITRLTRGVESPGPREHQATLYSIAVSADGKWGATGDANGHVSLWQGETQESHGDFLKIHRGIVTTLKFSRDGQRLATGGTDGVVTVWKVATRERLAALKGHSGPIQSLMFDARGQTLASASDDGDARVWTIPPAPPARVIGDQERPVFSVAWSPDGKRLAIGTAREADEIRGIVQIWNVATGILLRTLPEIPGRILSLAFTPDGRTLATGGYDSRVRLWAVEGEREPQFLPGQPSGPVDPSDHFDRAVGTLAISPDGTLLAAGYGNPTYHQADYVQEVRVWDLARGRELARLPGHLNTVCAVAFSPDSQTLATASDDHSVKLWSVRTGQLIRSLTGPERMKSVVFATDGRMVLAGNKLGTITVWETATGRPLRQLQGHSNAVNKLAFTRDGRTLASASWDHTVKLWDPVSGRETRTLRGHAAWVSCLAFSPDDNTLATGSFDQTVQLWEAVSLLQTDAPATASHAKTHQHAAPLRQWQ